MTPDQKSKPVFQKLKVHLNMTRYLVKFYKFFLGYRMRFKIILGSVKPGV